MAKTAAKRPTKKKSAKTSSASRKFAVPLLEHSDRLGWTIRAGDERRAGGQLISVAAR